MEEKLQRPEIIWKQHFTQRELTKVDDYTELKIDEKREADWQVTSKHRLP